MKNNLIKELESQISSLSQRVGLLAMENAIQGKVIKQIRQLQESQQTKGVNCSLGHTLCNIQHRKFNFVRKCTEYTPVTKCDKVIIQTEASFRDDTTFIKRLSKKIDILQAKFGVPSKLQDKVFVASLNNIYLESKKPEHSMQPKVRRNHRCGNVPLLMSVPKVTYVKPSRIPSSLLTMKSKIPILSYDHFGNNETKLDLNANMEECGNSYSEESDTSNASLIDNTLEGDCVESSDTESSLRSNHMEKNKAEAAPNEICDFESSTTSSHTLEEPCLEDCEVVVDNTTWEPRNTADDNNFCSNQMLENMLSNQKMDDVFTTQLEDMYDGQDGYIDDEIENCGDLITDIPDEVYSFVCGEGYPYEGGYEQVYSYGYEDANDHYYVYSDDSS